MGCSLELLDALEEWCLLPVGVLVGHGLVLALRGRVRVLLKVLVRRVPEIDAVEIGSLQGCSKITFPGCDTE